MCVTRSRSIASRITPGSADGAITLRAPTRASATIVAPAACVSGATTRCTGSFFGGVNWLVMRYAVSSERWLCMIAFGRPVVPPDDLMSAMSSARAAHAHALAGKVLQPLRDAVAAGFQRLASAR